MTNVFIVLIYAPFLIIMATLSIAVFFRKGSQAFIRQCRFFYVLIDGWLICEMLFFVISDPYARRFVFDLKLAFVAFLPVAMLFLMLVFFRLDAQLPRSLPWALCIIPSITSVLGATTLWHSMLITELTIHTVASVTVMDLVRAPWFYVHMVYSQMLNIVAGIVIIYRYRTLPQAYRGGSVLFFIGLGVYAFFTLIATFLVPQNSNIDFNIVGACLAAFFFYLVTLVNGRIDCLRVDSRGIFHSLDEPVFILDMRGKIMDKNAAAGRILRNFSGDSGLLSIEKLFDDMEQQRLLTRRINERDATQDLYFLDIRPPRVFQMHSRPMLDRNHILAGRYLILTDVTNDRMFADRIWEMGGVDSLTGIGNRYKYRTSMREVDASGILPLSVVLCDICGLKAVNSEYGYYEGDMRIKVAAEGLLACCPEDGIVTRIGGDRFAMILPGLDKQSAEKIARETQSWIEKSWEISSWPKVVLSAVTKTDVRENINLLIRQVTADSVLRASGQTADENQADREG